MARRFGDSSLVVLTTLTLGFLLWWGLPSGQAATPPAQFAASSENLRTTNEALAQMRGGGNAVDAAVTAALVAGVASPTSSGIGGGCFINYYDAKQDQVVILDAREVAPAGIVAAEFEKRPFSSAKRGKWVGVPGEVSGLFELHRRYGSKPWAEVVAPAIRAARDGYTVSRHLSRAVDWGKKEIAEDPSLKRLWLSGALPAGATHKNPKLAATLQRLAQEGPTALSEGSIAAEIVNTVRNHGGALALSDLQGYKVAERKPIKAGWGGYEVYTMPPPSAGGLMLAETLALYTPEELRQMGFNTPRYQHALAEAFRGALVDRMRYIGDPDHEAADLAKLLAPERMQARRASISIDKTKSLAQFAVEEHGTHHLVTADAEGNMVSLTTTVNRLFGAKLVAPTSGIVLNDELDDFTQQAHVAPLGMTQSPNRPRPGARPVSSMTPTIVLQHGRAVLAAGGSGGMNIAPNVAQTVIARLVFGISPEDAVAAPRFQLPLTDDTILVPEGTHPDHIADLKRRGESVGFVRFSANAVQMVAVDSAGMSGGADPRKFGSARVETVKP